MVIVAQNIIQQVVQPTFIQLICVDVLSILITLQCVHRGICRVGIFFTLKKFTFNGKNFGAFKVSLEFLCRIYEKKEQKIMKIYIF